jgi:hypothetical protein
LYCGGLTATQAALTGVNRVSDLTATLRQCLRRSKDRAIAVIPEGPYVVPLYQRGARGAPDLRREERGSADSLSVHQA